jgi:glycosyltransferase involved in cell wall biosynthesis
MRITIVLGPFLPVPTVLGGAVEKVHLLLAGAYRAAGHEVTIVSRRFGDFPHEEIVDGIRHLRIASFDGTSSLLINILLTLRYAARVARHLPVSDITVANVFALPLILRRRRAGKIYVHVARFPKHQMQLYRRADRVQAISHAVADAIARQAPALADRVVTIGYPVPDVYFQRGTAPRQRTILYVGRLAREKGVHLLLKAFATVMNAAPGWRLRIVGPHEASQGGDGATYLEELRTLARPLGAACDFVGPIFDQEALAREYQAVAIFVYPSVAETGEAFGLAPLEAMAAGCAAVVSDLRCFDDYLTRDVTGLVFNHRGEHPERALATKLLCLATEPDLLRRLAEAGSHMAEQFRTSAIAGRMLDDFASLFDNGHTGVATASTRPPRIVTR